MISSRQSQTRRAAGPQRTRGRCAVGPQAHVSVRLRTGPGARGLLCRSRPLLCLRTGSAHTRHATRRAGVRVSFEHAVNYCYLLAHPASTQATVSSRSRLRKQRPLLLNHKISKEKVSFISGRERHVPMSNLIRFSNSRRQLHTKRCKKNIFRWFSG